MSGDTHKCKTTNLYWLNKHILTVLLKKKKCTNFN